MVDICREKKRQVWRKSAVNVTENERCKLVLNAVFYWEPVEFFQKRCDMITLFWIFCMRAICSSATLANVALQ